MGFAIFGRIIPLGTWSTRWGYPLHRFGCCSRASGPRVTTGLLAPLATNPFRFGLAEGDRVLIDCFLLSEGTSPS